MVTKKTVNKIIVDGVIKSLKINAEGLLLFKKGGWEFTDEQIEQIDKQILIIMKATGIEEIRNIKKKQKCQTPRCAFL